MTIGILTEKPSAARNFAAALGGMSGSYQGQDYVIAHARGHLMELKEPAEMVPADQKERYARSNWQLEHLPWELSDFTWEYTPRGATPSERKDSESLMRDIAHTFAGCEEIVIATDVDPSGEGEMLAWLILDHLGLSPRTFSRMWFTDEAVSSLQKAFTGRTPIPSMRQDPDFLKAEVRNHFDLLSMQFTRVATVVAGQRGMVLRQGRLKSFMVRRVHEQLQAYKNYKKVPFFESRFRDENGVVYANPDEPRFATQAEVPGGYSTSPVVLDSREDRRTAPPRLVDLSGLASILSSRGISAKDVLSTYQKMYEAQVVSYPRTEDKTITTEQFDELLPKVDQIAGVLGVSTSLLTHRTPRRTHVKDTGAHGANRPGPNVPDSLEAVRASYGPTGQAIYELLGRSYLAMLAEDYLYERQSGHLELYPAFVGAVNVPRSLGFKEVFNPDAEEDDDEAGTGLGTSADPFIHEGAPPRPARPTMRWLIKELEKHDVGTGATRTSTYAEVIAPDSKKSKMRAQLLTETKGKLDVTEVGTVSALLLPGTHIARLDLTSWLTEQMEQVAQNKTTHDEVLAVVADWVREDIETMKNNVQDMQETTGLTAKAPRETWTGNWEGKEVTFNRKFASYRFSDAECEALCQGEEVAFDFTSANGKEFSVVGALADLVNSEGKPYVGLDVGFSDSVPNSWAAHEFTDAEKQTLESGGEVVIHDAVFKSGPAKGPVSVRYGEEQPGGKKKIIPAFADPLKADEPPAAWAGHTFTDAEKASLKAGESVVIHDAVFKSGPAKGPVSVRFGEDPAAGGKKKVIPEFADPLKADEPPASWAGHTFTDAEKKALVDGQSVQVTDGTKRNGEPMKPVAVYFEKEKPSDPRKKIVPEFARASDKAKSAKGRRGGGRR